MRSSQEQNSLFERANFLLIMFALIFVAVIAAVIGRADRANEIHPFSEPLIAIADGWKLTDSAGHVSERSLPTTLEYGTDGRYTLETVLNQQDMEIAAPTIEFYSNYTDVKIFLNGEQLLSFPNEAPSFTAGTGNTWQFVRLPTDFAGQTLRMELRCQLGGGVSYFVKPLMLGAKATMLNNTLMESLPYLVVSICMAALSLTLTAMYYILRRRLALNSSILSLAVFAAVFAAYIFCESSYARMCVPNGHVLYFCTFALLALMPAPLIGFFSRDLGPGSRRICTAFSLLSLACLFIQMTLHLAGVSSLRLMLPLTHAVIIVSSVATVACMLTADHRLYPGARKKLLSAAPMLLGGGIDILLLALKHPSFNNSLWLVLGVSLFLLLQFGTFLSAYFTMYRSAVEAELLREMAFHDLLTNTGNRNAYEQFLKELGEGPAPEGFCCIVADINNLKFINDTYGHHAGDSAIQAAGAVLDALIPAHGHAFRTGGDEFVVLLEGMSESAAGSLAATIAAEAARRGEKLQIPLSLAVGCGSYREDDGKIQDFIRRVDTCMYENKRTMKWNQACQSTAGTAD